MHRKWVKTVFLCGTFMFWGCTTVDSARIDRLDKRLAAVEQGQRKRPPVKKGDKKRGTNNETDARYAILEKRLDAQAKELADLQKELAFILPMLTNAESASGDGQLIVADETERPGEGATAVGEGRGVARIPSLDDKERLAAGELYREAYESLAQGFFGEALELFNRFIEGYPRHEFADNSQFWIGECYFRQKKYESAARAFLEVELLFPEGNRVGDALLHGAICRIRLGQRVEARALLERVISEHPLTDAETRARELIGQIQ